MIVEVPEKLEAALKAHAKAHGVSPEDYVCEVLERELRSSEAPPKGSIADEARHARQVRAGSDCRRN
ncbi:MAG: hypothetical protein JOZ83_08600 [Silvibacterium sp.]|nr:hypothetical protein [Silvibacterium sp.]